MTGWQEGDDSHDDWRNLKQVSDTADADMEDQLTYLFRMAELSLEACEEGYGDDEEAQEKCEKKETRKMCYMYESMSQLCDSTLEQVPLVPLSGDCTYGHVVTCSAVGVAKCCRRRVGVLGSVASSEVAAAWELVVA